MNLKFGGADLGHPTIAKSPAYATKRNAAILLILIRIEAAVMQKPFNRDLAKDNPDRFFENPQQIVKETLLTRGEKIATVNRWRQTILEELSATGEGMRTHGVSSDRSQLLEQIEQAKAELARMPDD
jgi:hypothetical protein